MKTSALIHEPVRTINDPDESSRSVDTVVLAFSADPAARWLFPEAPVYANAFPAFVRAFGGPALENQSVHFVPGFRGAAFWFEPGVHGNDDAVIEVLQQAVPSDRLEDVFGVFEQMDAFHPAEPHWYLPLIGVDPPHQGRGHGTALLRHALEECDRAGLPAYLESSSAANLPLYERHGFRRMGEIQAGDSPVLYPMRRAPQAIHLL